MSLQMMLPLAFPLAEGGENPENGYPAALGRIH